MEIDVISRLAEARQKVSAMRLYALVDGAQYMAHRGVELTDQHGARALFNETDDALLAHAGPWLFDAELTGSEVIKGFGNLESSAPAISWLITPQDLDGLAQMLRLRIDMKLPDGRAAMLRFWDPRVLVSIAKTLDEAQRDEFFAHIHEWHVLDNGQRVWIGRSDAYAQ